MANWRDTSSEYWVGVTEALAAARARVDKLASLYEGRAENPRLHDNERWAYSRAAGDLRELSEEVFDCEPITATPSPGPSTAPASTPSLPETGR